MAIICPLCDGNGLIQKWKVKPSEIVIYVCDECEATWIHPETISEKTVFNLDLFLKPRISDYKNDLEVLGYYEGEKYEDDNKLVPPKYWKIPKKQQD